MPCLTNTPFCSLTGEIEKIIEFSVDVTDQKRLALESDRRQAELKNYLSGINNTIASAEFDMNGELTNANDIFLTVMGYHLPELKGAHFTALMGGSGNRVNVGEFEERKILQRRI